MFHITAFGSFGKCYVENEHSAGANKDKAKKFDTFQAVSEFRDKHWPESEVSTRIEQAE